MCSMKEEECKKEMKQTHSKIDALDEKVDVVMIDIEKTKATVEMQNKLLWWILGILSAVFLSALFFFLNIPK